MNRIIFITVLLIAFVSSKKPKVSIFYESQCPDCIQFFKSQLTPVVKELGNTFILDLIPYGNGNQTFHSGQWYFNCQHGPKECEYNKLHTSAVNVYKQKPKIYIKFILCLMADKSESDNLVKCAKKSGVNLKVLKKQESLHGDEWLADMGKRTHNFKPPIKWVPTIVFNDKYNQTVTQEAEKGLKKVVCKYLHNKPKPCRNSSPKWLTFGNDKYFWVPNKDNTL